VNGDTVFVRYADGAEGYVRLIGVDTPEDVKPGYPVECGAWQAAKSMKAMSAGRQATLYTDPARTVSTPTAGSSRISAWVAAISIECRSAKGGYTNVYEYPFQQAASFLKAQATARRLDPGAWGDCGGDFHSASRGSSTRTMSGPSRLGREVYPAVLLAVAFLALGVWRLVMDDTGFGVFYFALAAGWLLIGFYKRRRARP
jgi:endonuclease YncB( thermonuclease family)